MSEQSRRSQWDRSLFRWRRKVWGGLQFWADVYFFHDWRIQWGVLSNSYRLLDGRNYLYQTGTYEQCLEKLQQIRAEQKLPPMKGKAVVLIHGILRTRFSMSRFRKPLEEAGYNVFIWSYPSTRVTIQQAADLLARALSSLEGMEQVNFIVHSMGGLVLRACLAKHKKHPPLGRVVMLGVPNLGAHLADRLRGLWLFRLLFGPAGQQLVTDPDGLIAQLPPPPCEFAIIAGARGKESGYNPLIPGDDDGTVAVASTRLPGAADFMTVRTLHSFLAMSSEVVEASVRFIQTGSFRASGERQPIPSTSSTEQTATFAQTQQGKQQASENSEAPSERSS